MRGFEDIGSKGHFSAKKGVFWAKIPPGGQTRIFFKNPLGTLSRQDATLCQVSEKSDARISRYRVADARTDGRTDERESIGPSANAETPITILRTIHF